MQARHYMFAIGVAVGAGCGFRIGAAPADGTVPGDGTADAPIDVADAPALCMAWQPKLFQPCPLGSPMPALTLPAGASPYTYDTTNLGGVLTDSVGTVLLTSSLTHAQTGGPEAAVLSVAELTVEAGATLNVIGNKPLIVASWGSITIAGTINAGSRGAIAGAGAGPADCTSQQATPGQIGVSTGGSGGGGGGAMRGAGGNGGQGDSPPGPLGGPGGTALMTVPSYVRGGCGGATSGAAGPGSVVAPSNANTVSLGGAGGGGLQLAARLNIAVSGRVLAGGAGGGGAPQGSACGGGGGGAGGWIGFDAVAIDLTGATVAANGGGGGGSGPFAGSGNRGTDGQPSNMAAQGGVAAGGTCGLAGASGSAGSTFAGSNATGNDSCGGGGGGGGAGYVLVWGALTLGGAIISPPSQLAPF